MGGVIGTMVYIQKPPLEYVGLLILIMFIMMVTTGRLLGRGDVSTLSWIVIGTGLISLPRLLVFLMFFMLILGCYLGVKRVIGEWGNRSAGMPVIMGAFLITAMVIC